MRTVEREIAGAFIFSADSKLLLGKSRVGGTYADLYIPPGGGIEPDETRLQAVLRETLEETGLDVADADITELPDISTGQSEKNLRDTGERVLVKMTFYDFIIRLAQRADEVAAKPSDDLGELRWFTAEELVTASLSPSCEYRLRELDILHQ